MRVLAIDTAVEACSLAYDNGGGVVWARSLPMSKGHAEHLFPLFEEMKAELGWSEACVPDRLVVTTGPGTFTGARVGLSAARAMALTWGCPCLGVSTLEALAVSVPRDAHARVGVIDARRGQLYAQAFDGAGVPLCEPLAEAPEVVVSVLKDAIGKAGKVALAGSGSQILADHGPESWTVSGDQRA